MEHLTEEQLWELVDSPAAAPVALKAHANTCPLCSARLRECRDLNAQLAALPLEMPSVAFTDKVLEQWAVAQQPQTVPMRRKISRRVPFLFAATMGVLGLLAAFLVSSGAPAGTMPVRPLVETAGAIGEVFADKTVLSGLLLVNALLLLWLFNQRVLNPLFQRRLAG
jgi:hypothetical protein